MIIRWLKGLWYARLREIDRKILWPSCVKLAPTLDEAKAAFGAHAFHDPAWQFLGDDEIFRQIDRLAGDGEE